MIFVRKTLPILLIAFFVSVILRLPQLNRPLSKHHEFCTAVSLNIIQNWWDNGIENVGYAPATNFPNKADKFINNFANATGKIVDKNGNFYYVSHPPFAYYLPYYFFKLIGVRPEVIHIQLFNFGLHFLTALFVYFTLSLLSFNSPRSILHIPSFVAFLFFLFAPATLWFQGNVYMSDMAVQAPFVIGVYIALKMIIRRKFFVTKYILFYALILFLMIYTSWLGLFFALAIFLYSLLHVKEIKGFRVLIWTTIIVAIIALRLIFYQYSNIAGAEAYLSELFNRYLIRGSLGDIQNGVFAFIYSYFIFFKNLLYNYTVNYIVFFLIIFGFIYVVFSKNKLKITFSENGYRFIWISLLPIGLLHVLFLNYSEHDFTVLYASLFLSVLMGVFYDKIKKSGAVALTKLNVAYSIALVLLMLHFTFSNLPGKANYKGDIYSLDKAKADFISANSDTSEVLFMYEKPEPQLIFYAKRNIKVVKSEEEAIAFLNLRKIEKGRLFDFSGRQPSFQMLSID
jgi:hypothetical protein